MNFTTSGIKVLSAAACLAFLGGCFPAETEPATEQPGLAKVTASELDACPKYTNIVTSFAVEIRNCAQGAEGIDDCAPAVLKLIKPFLTCLDIPTPTVNSVQDLGDVSTELSNRLSELDNDQSKLLSFAECVCGGGSGSFGTSLGVSHSSAAGSEISASSSSAAGSQTSASSSSAAGSQTSNSSSSAAGSRMSRSSSGN